MKKIRCGKCKVILAYNPNELNPNKPLLKCPKCKAVNKVPLSQNKSADDHLDENTIHKPVGNTHEVGWIVVHDENTHTQTYPLRLGKNTIGRKSVSKPCDVMIETQDRYMSRQHCVIEVVQNRRGQYDYVIYNINTANGTFINASVDKKLSDHDEIYLKDGHTIQMGHTKVVLKTKEMALNINEAQNTVVNMNYSKTIFMG